MPCKNHEDIFNGLVVCSRCGTEFCYECIIDPEQSRVCVTCKDDVDEGRSQRLANFNEARLAELVEVAKAQKAVLWCVLGNLTCLLPPVFLLLSFIFFPYYVSKLASALKCKAPALWAAGMFVPILSLILLVVLSQE